MSAIARIDAYALEYPEPNDRDRLRCVTLARVVSDDGAVGWGEAISQWPDSAVATAAIIDRGFAPLLVGRDATDVRGAWEAMRARTFWYGRGGAASFAISAVDSALWDIAGKLAGQPVHALLGGKLHDRVPACASTIFDPGDLEWTASEFATYVAAGFRAVKGGWGRDPATGFGTDPDRDEAVVRTLRETVGPDVGISIDVSGLVTWTADHAVAMARRLEPYRLAWLEDALPHADWAGYRALRAAAPMPIATGERDWTIEDYEHRLEHGTVDILLIDPGRVEGVTGLWLAAQAAAARGVRWVPHSWSSALNTYAALHVYAATTNGEVFELKPRPGPMQYDLVDHPVEQVDGFIEIPSRPGFGCEVDLAVVERYAIR